MRLRRKFLVSPQMTIKTFPESFRRKFKIWRRFVTSRLVSIRAGENENTVWVIGGATKVVKRASFFCQKEQKLFIIFLKIIVSWRHTNLKKVVLLPSVGRGPFPGLGLRVSTFSPLLILLSILGWTSPRRCCFDGEAFSSSEQKLLLLWSSSSSISKLVSVRFFWPENDPRPITSKCTTAWSTAGSASPRTRTSRWTTPPTPSTSRHRSPTSPPRINTLGDNFLQALRYWSLLYNNACLRDSNSNPLKH